MASCFSSLGAMQILTERMAATSAAISTCFGTYELMMAVVAQLRLNRTSLKRVCDLRGDHGMVATKPK